MKTYILIFIACITFNLYSQSNDIYVLVKDGITNTVIPQVPILALEIDKEGFTNTNGVFKISTNQPLTLSLRHPKYEIFNISTHILTERLNIIYLQPLPIINEVEIKVVDSFDILSELIENSKNVLTNPVALKVYFLEFYKKNNIYTSFNDGLLNFHISGKPNRIKADIIIEQNRLYGLPEYNYGTNIIGYNLDKLILSSYNFTYLDLFLDKKNRTKYTSFFTTSVTNPNHYKIKLELKETIKEALPNFEIIYDYTKMLIIKVESNIAEHALLHAGNKKFDLDQGKLLHSKFKANYKISGNLYHLSNSTEVIGIKMFKKNGTIDLLDIKNYFIVNDVNTESLNYNKKNVFKQKSLNKIKTKYYNNYWDFKSEIYPTAKEIEAREKLSSETLN